MKKLPFIFIVLIFCFFAVSSASMTEAAGASLSIFPQTGTFTVSNKFDVSVFLNTAGNNVNVVNVNLKFDPDKLQVIAPTKGISSVGEWVFPPTFSNKTGLITFRGGFTGRGINTSEGLISIITFRAMATGETELNFLDSSQVISIDEQGADILSSVNRGIYNIIPSPPMGPRIFSETHPDQNKWYKAASPTFSWQEIANVQGYSYLLNDDSLGEPDNIIDTESTSVFFEDTEEGAQYFHLKAKKGGVWGGTSHFKIIIDKTPPEKFKPHIESFALTPSTRLLIYFDTEDFLSGIDYYQVRIADQTDPQNLIWSGWMQEQSPFSLNVERSGVFEVLIRAFDKAGNFQEEKIKARIINPNLLIVSGGMQIRGLFLAWWLIFVLLAIISFLAYLIFKKWKGKGSRVDLEREIKEAEKEIEDVRKAKEKLGEMKNLKQKGKGEWQRLRNILGRLAKSSRDKKR